MYWLPFLPFEVHKLIHYCFEDKLSIKMKLYKRMNGYRPPIILKQIQSKIKDVHKKKDVHFTRRIYFE